MEDGEKWELRKTNVWQILRERKWEREEKIRQEGRKEEVKMKTKEDKWMWKIVRRKWNRKERIKEWRKGKWKLRKTNEWQVLREMENETGKKD